jgi:hypothetical protein
VFHLVRRSVRIRRHAGGVLSVTRGRCKDIRRGNLQTDCGAARRAFGARNESVSKRRSRCNWGDWCHDGTEVSKWNFPAGHIAYCQRNICGRSPSVLPATLRSKAAPNLSDRNQFSCGRILTRRFAGHHCLALFARMQLLQANLRAPITFAVTERGGLIGDRKLTCG